MEHSNDALTMNLRSVKDGLEIRRRRSVGESEDRTSDLKTFSVFSLKTKETDRLL